MQAVVLAGGKGTRLRPYTTLLPKPLMPIGDMPVVEVIIRQLRAAGFERVILAVGYLPDLFRALIGDGERMGGPIEFVREEIPLGTAGALGLISGLDSDFLLINGDTLTTLDYRAFMEYHRKHGAIATIAAQCRQNPVDYGVLEIADDQRLTRYVEKPVQTYHVSMGVNAFRADVLQYVEPNRYLDIPQLMQVLMDKGQPVQCYQSDCFWLDIGRPADYEKALEVFQERRAEFLGNSSCGS
jgi:NDP-sugar pyrophosphorylase family protein